jgi:hypothetical protein
MGRLPYSELIRPVSPRPLAGAERLEPRSRERPSVTGSTVLFAGPFVNRRARRGCGHGRRERPEAALRNLDARLLARQAGTVVPGRIVREPRGTPRLSLGPLPAERKGLAVTRSLGRPGAALAEPLETVAAFGTRAAEKLRGHGLVAGQLRTFLHTDPHEDGPRHHGARSIRLVPMSDDTRQLVAAAGRCAIYRPICP